MYLTIFNAGKTRLLKDLPPVWTGLRMVGPMDEIEGEGGQCDFQSGCQSGYWRLEKRL